MDTPSPAAAAGPAPTSLAPAPVMSVRTAAAWALVSQYTSFAIQFATSVVLARWFITPAQLGLFSIAFAAVTIVAFLQDFGVTRYINGERELTPEKLHTAFTISVLFAWGIALLAIAAAVPVAHFYRDPALLPVTLVVACSYLLVPLSIVPQATCQRRMDYRSNTMIEVGSSVCNAAAAVTFAVLGHGALALAWGAFAQQGARLVISQWRTGLMLPWPLRLRDAGPVLQLGGTNSVQAVCNSVTARAPELVIGRLIDSAAVGLFARASGLALQLRMLVAGAVTGVFYPAFRRVRDSGDPLGPPYLRVVAAYTGVTWPAMAGIAVLAEPLVSTLYGPRWLAAAPLLWWIALSQLCYVALPLNADLPLLLGRMKGLLHRNLAETVASVVLLALAAPFGLAWVAASRLAHGVLWVVVYAPFMREMLGFSWRDLASVWLRSAAVTVAAVAPLLLSYALWAPAARSGLAQNALMVFAGVALWLAMLRIVRHPLFAEITGMLAEIATTVPFLRGLPFLRHSAMAQGAAKA
ncbi:oligosaccharide flippase family protein [Novosphingobium cyanobacteriorum]|uniref:Oligosaccharide flippase family protein n=1 Tax=Novosphingobium cyanobacteriorum TaxID=3024215 RepID=A0ABT6CFN7_9SPHN|nr:oligosaccharide flippase family protein [Novosphingobium cyanobacteriorum]MDF8332735.1 oligosaccharide flippase family protein [Novosphingobium cyanobacteriorum]